MHNFVSKNNQKPSYQNGMKTTVASKITSNKNANICTYTNTTSRITLSNLRYSQHVFISKSTKSSRICTVSIDLYLVKDSFIISFSIFLQNFYSWKHYGVCVCLYLLCYSSDRYYVLIYLVTQLSCVIDYYTISKRGYLSSILWYM